MEWQLVLFSLPFFLTVAFLFIITSGSAALIKRKLQFERPKEPYAHLALPPGPWQLPIVGSIHHLAGALPHHRLRELAVKCKAPHLMLIRLGELNLVVASSREAAREVMKTQDANFASRPALFAAEIVAYNCTDLVFSPYGSYYKMLRKIIVMELLGAKRVKSFGRIRADEVRNLVAGISASMADGPVNLSAGVKNMTSSVLCRAAFGKKCRHQQQFLSASKQAVQIATGFCVVDSFPSVVFLDVLTGVRRRLEDIHRQLDAVFDDILNDHLEERAKRKTTVAAVPAEDGEDGVQEDIVDVLLRLREEGGLEFPLTLDNIKAVILDIFLGGTETSIALIEWAMSELMRKQSTLEKVQKDIREVMKGRTELEETDVAEFTYLKLVVKETLRLHPPAPLLPPRICKETCEMLGYKIPSGTRIMINAYALGRDSRYWEDADSFVPERFEGSDVDLKGASFEFVPFGAGRRMCPGVEFGLAGVEFALAQLLFYFDWELPGGMKPQELDMSEMPGASATRNTELKLIAKQRIPLSAA